MRLNATFLFRTCTLAFLTWPSTTDNCSVGNKTNQNRYKYKCFQFLVGL